MARFEGQNQLFEFDRPLIELAIEAYGNPDSKLERYGATATILKLAKAKYPKIKFPSLADVHLKMKVPDRKTRQQLIDCTKFNLSDEFTEFVAEMSTQLDPQAMLNVVWHSRLPFDNMWIEWSEPARLNALSRHQHSQPAGPYTAPKAGVHLRHLSDAINVMRLYTPARLPAANEAHGVDIPTGRIILNEWAMGGAWCAQPDDEGIKEYLRRMNKARRWDKDFDKSYFSPGDHTGPRVTEAGIDPDYISLVKTLSEIEPNEDVSNKIDNRVHCWSPRWVYEKALGLHFDPLTHRMESTNQEVGLRTIDALRGPFGRLTVAVMSVMQGPWIDSAFWMRAVSDLLPEKDQFWQDMMQKQMDETTGDLRFVLCCIAFLQVYKTILGGANPINPAMKSKAERRRAYPTLEIRMLDVRLPKKKDVKSVARRFATGIKKRRHEVSGHYRRYRSGKEVFISSYWRGDATLGVIKKDYNVKLGNPAAAKLDASGRQERHEEDH